MALIRSRGTLSVLIALSLAGTFTACSFSSEASAPEPKKPAAQQAIEAKERAAEQAAKEQGSAEQPAEEPVAPHPTDEPALVETPVEAATPDAATLPSPDFDRNQHSIDDPMSIWVVGNKLRPFDPADFEPSDLVATEGVANDNGQPLREVAARATEQMIASARDAGHDVRIISAYRDYNLQVQLYDSYVARDGQAEADTYSARPGHSEHQTGLTVDLDDYGACYLMACFGETPAGQWLAENAADHGFIVRYPDQKQEITGFTPEPWHFRYVGSELATEMKTSGVSTLEEFFGLPAAPGYAG